MESNIIAEQKAQQDLRLKENLSCIKNKIIVMSGKGGVGKSTVAVNVAVGLSLQDLMVGLLDVDLHGPNVPKMLGARDLKPSRKPDGRLGAIKYSPNLKFLSIEPFLPSEDTAVIWRGPIKHSAIRQFIGDIDWGELDYLVIDAPPGTGDEPLTVAKTMPDAYALVVTTPQEVSLIDVKKAIRFCQKIKLRILGIVENMSGFICPHCGKPVDIFKKGGGQKLADELGVRFAFPTQTIHIEEFPEKKALSPEYDTNTENMNKKIAAFMSDYKQRLS